VSVVFLILFNQRIQWAYGGGLTRPLNPHAMGGVWGRDLLASGASH
jgi:hypothetical protein